MTLRTDMVANLRRAPAILGEASGLVARFFQAHQHPQGGYRGRSEAADLYYTVFGLEGSLALGLTPDSDVLVRYLNEFGDGRDLDLVHLACLARVWATVAEMTGAKLAPQLKRDLAQQLARTRCPDGGFHTGQNEAFGSAYGSFLALSAYQDLEMPMPDVKQMLEDLRALQQPDGAFTNDRSSHIGSTPAVAAALCVLQELKEPLPNQTLTWLQAQTHPQGGFLATPSMEAIAMPDLLSTATALFTLSRASVSLDALKEISLDFCDNLWNPEGGFAGHRLDPTLDCEYTYYGLLALGVLTSTAE